MFNRELRDLDFVRRWSIVRTLRDQTVASHTFFVVAYVNDICVSLDVSMKVHLSALQRAITHDWDEIFTGDIPGPHKHKLLKLVTIKNHWKNQIGKWTNAVFDKLSLRDGSLGIDPSNEKMIDHIVKVADYLDAAVFLGGEMQMGNGNVGQIYLAQAKSCIDEAAALCDLLKLEDARATEFLESLWAAMERAQSGVSMGHMVALDDSL